MRKIFQQAHTGLKHLIAAILYYSGYLHIYKHLHLRDHAVVLMYHRVLPPEYKEKTFTHPAITVSDNTFAKHISFLSKKFNIMPIKQFADHILNKIPFPRNSCLITFDDGWIDNYLYAYPILKKNGANAVIFIPHDYIDSKNMFWPEQLGFLLYQSYLNKDRLSETLQKHGLGTILSSTPQVAKEMIDDFVHQLRNNSYKKIYKIIDDIKKEMSRYPDIQQFNEFDSFSNWEQLVEMQDNGISFGSHTLSHRLLTQLDQSEVSLELKESKSRLASRFKRDITIFAYPNGNKNDKIIDAVRGCGYKLAFSTDGGFVSCTDYPYTIRRMNMNDSGTKYLPMFYCRILGIM